MPRSDKRPDITKTCDHCGEQFTRPDWKVWREARYCGGDCYTAARRALPATERAALMANATARIRGATRSHEDLCKRARTKQDRATLSDDEREILAAMSAADLDPIPHYALDKYNIDFAFPAERVAVEYQGGNWHNTPLKREQDERKASFLKSQGWHLIVLPRLDKPQPNNAGNRRIAIDDVVRLTVAAINHQAGSLTIGASAN